MKTQIDKTLEYLNKDKLKHCDLLVMLQIYKDKIHFIYAENDGVCFSIEDKGLVCLATSNLIVAKRVCEKITNCRNCIAKNKHDMEAIKGKFNFDCTEECHQVLFKEDKPYLNDKDIRKLDKDDIDFIVENYSGNTDHAEISELMELFDFYGINYENKLVGFVGRHTDGEIGYLEILKPYRRHHLGTRLVRYIVSKSYQEELLPYAQIKIENEASINLHKKLGCEFCPTTVFWLYNL